MKVLSPSSTLISTKETTTETTTETTKETTDTSTTTPTDNTSTTTPTESTNTNTNNVTPEATSRSGQTVTVGDTRSQGGGYTVEGVEQNWTSGSAQRQMYDQWKANGEPLTSYGTVAASNGDPVVAVSDKFGQTGDSITVHLSDGTSFNAVIGDAKSYYDSNSASSGDGHNFGSNGQYLNVVEFQVPRGYSGSFSETAVNSRNNDIPWDSNANVVSITNNGKVFMKQ